MWRAAMARRGRAERLLRVATGRKRAHHFVSAFYLAEFVDPGHAKRLWQYDKASGEIHPTSPRDARRRSDYHSIPKLDGTIDARVEDALAKVEDQAAPVLRKLMAGERLENDERSIVSYFVALMIVRVPSFRDGAAKFKAAIVKSLTQLRAIHGGFDSILLPEGGQKSIAKAKEALRRGDFDVEVRSHGTLDVLPAAEKVAATLHSLTWIVVEARGKTRFVTSDNPVTYVDPTVDPKSWHPVGLANRAVEVTFRLSATMALLAARRAGDLAIHRIRATENMVRAINRRTVAGASRFVFASEKSDPLMRLVMKLKDSGPRWETR